MSDFETKFCNVQNPLRSSEAASQARSVAQFPDLTRCQKETLIALRSAGVASVSQISRLLNKDQDNVRKRLAVLVRKGYAVKFLHPKGFRYLAPARRADPSLKPSVHKTLKSLLPGSATQLPTGLPDLLELPDLPRLPAIPALPNLPTRSSESTTENKSKIT